MHAENELVALQHTLYTSSNPTRRWLHCTRRDWIFDAMKRVMPPARERALEVGPGSGIYLPLLAGLFKEVYATDIEEAYLNNARPLQAKYENLKLQADDITASKLAPQSFDLILCTEVVEHIADSAAAIAGMKRLLKPGGVLIMSTPQRYSPLELAAKIAFLPGIIQVVRMIYREPILETGHINLMTAATAENQLTQAGLIIQERYKSGMYIPLVAEFAGQTGLKLEQWLERKLLGSFADGLLWTQYYIARSA
jgi:2-polyprenyl-3-methyl-5-hydroxy-6-metoxy-1,4-benzoquinol methylase